MHDTEDRGIRADAERQRGADNGHETGRASESAPGLAQIDEERIEPGPDTGFPDVFADRDEPARSAEGRDRGAARRRSGHARAFIAVGKNVNRRAKLLVELAVERLAPGRRVPDA